MVPAASPRSWGAFQVDMCASQDGHRTEREESSPEAGGDSEAEGKIRFSELMHTF